MTEPDGTYYMFHVRKDATKPVQKDVTKATTMEVGEVPYSSQQPCTQAYVYVRACLTPECNRSTVERQSRYAMA